MKIMEIQRPDSQQLSDEILQKAGYRRLAYGEYGAVYEKPNSNKVIKTFTALDVGYLEFIKLAKSSNKNPHFPFFFGNPIKITPDYYAVKQENLDTYRGNSRPIRQYIEYLISGIKIGYPSDFEEIEEIMEYNPRFKEACEMIAELVKSTASVQLDIHKNNIMKRGKTLVFVDPVSTPTMAKNLPNIKNWPIYNNDTKPTKFSKEFQNILDQL